ncbi:glycosyltransferase involved in cell wall biosynthesis [Marinitoga litoralis]|nr:glycosyltransferase involved in cell wall biosynthesis [Marinitoga litoralis]
MKVIIKNPQLIINNNIKVLKRKLKLNLNIEYFKKNNFNKYNIIHAHDVLSLIGIHHNNIVLTLHGYFAKESLNYNDYTEKDAKKIYDYSLNIERKAIKKAKKIIAVDTRIKNYLINEFNYPENNIEVIFNFVDTDKFVPISEEKIKKLRKRYNIPEKAFVILVPRRYVNKNGVLYAARAFKKIKNKNFYYIFSGRGPLKNKLLEILNNSNNAIVLEGVNHEEIVKYYQISDVVLIPSITTKEGIEEATSLSMLEGMSCEKIVVCSNIGGMKEVIKENETGFLIKQKNEENIIKILEYIYENYNKLKNIRKNARKYVIRNHGYIEYTRKIVKIYEEILNR